MWLIRIKEKKNLSNPVLTAAAWTEDEICHKLLFLSLPRQRCSTSSFLLSSLFGISSRCITYGRKQREEKEEKV